MNKAQLVEALTTRIGDRRTAAAAVDGLVDVIVETVGSGRSVTLTGFGVFEPRRRAARVARNPRTGETVPVPETIVPSFRPGAAFRDQIGRSREAAAGATSAPRRAPRDGATADAGSGAAAPPRQRSRSSSGRAGAAKPAARTGGTGRGTKAAVKPAAKAAPPTSATSGASGAAAEAVPAKQAPAKRTTRAAKTTTRTAKPAAGDAAAAPAKRSRSRASST